MELNPNQWHVKFYFWCLDVWDAFLDTYTDRDRSNLCQYIRTIFVWMPLALVANIAFWLYLVYVLLYFPITHFGVIGIGGGYMTIAIIGGTIGIYFYLKEKLKQHRREQRRAAERTADVASSDAAVEKEERGPGFIEVIWLYLVATKQKVCPTIEFRANRMKEDV